MALKSLLICMVLMVSVFLVKSLIPIKYGPLVIFASCFFELLLQVDPVSAGVQYDKEFIVCSLDLLSGLAEGLGSGIESLVFPFCEIS